MSRFSVAISPVIRAAIAVCAAALVLPAAAFAIDLDLESTYTLGSDLEQSSCNFHPQGLGYNEDTDELLFMQQCPDTIYVTDLTGVVTDSVFVNKNHTTSVAVHDGDYYFSDYTSNSSGQDMWSIPTSGGSLSSYGSYVAAYGGFPIDIRDGLLYRTELSTTYNWSNLDEIHISDVNTPDSVTSTYSLGTTEGIGDIAVDVDNNWLWVLEYKAGADIHRYDLDTGALLESYALGLEGETAGITYGAGKLYYWDWENGNSTLSVYNIGSVVIQVDSTVSLAGNLEQASCNFHPQGLGYNDATNELLFMQQCPDTIYVTDLSGNITDSVFVNKNHTTSVAAHGGNYYFSDYTGNSSTQDMWSIATTGGSLTSYGSYVAAYGGFPIDIRDDLFYRTELSTSYSWANLDEIHVSNVDTPDVVDSTYSISGSDGIGDIAVDVDHGWLWVLEYSSSADIHRYDLATGDLLQTYPLALEGETAGLTYGDGFLYYYDWENGDSTLTIIEVISPEVDITLDGTTSLAAELEQNSCNFHPQGLGFDEGTSQLLFMQQCSHPIYITDLDGVVQDSLSVGFNHQTSVAADDSLFYFSDYTGNTSFQDMHTIPKTGGSASDYGSDVAAYGGFPIDVRDDTLWRTELSTSYNWSNLNEIWRSDTATPDLITNQYLINTNGVGDIAVDLDHNWLWVLDYSSSADLHRISLATGYLLQTYDLNLEGETAGLTYGNNQLFYWDWENGNSTLSVYDIDAELIDSDGDGDPDDTDCDDTDATVYTGAPEDCDAVDSDCDGSVADEFPDYDGDDDPDCVDPPPAGSIIITEIMQNPAAVSDANGEWFEVLNTTADDIDLIDWVFSDNGSDTFTVESSVVVAAGGRAVFAANGDFGTNGGVDEDYEYGSFTLGNADDELYLADSSGSGQDAVEWDDGATFPDPEGASMTVAGSSETAAGNDAGENWCVNETPYGDGDLGTPGAAGGLADFDSDGDPDCVDPDDDNDGDPDVTD